MMDDGHRNRYYDEPTLSRKGGGSTPGYSEPKQDDDSAHNESNDEYNERKCDTGSPLFGTEMTFTNEALLELNKQIRPRKDALEVKKALADKLAKKRERWRAKIIEFADCKLISMKCEEVSAKKQPVELDEDAKKGEIRFTFPEAPFHGWWFSVKLDRPCLELSTKPATSEQYEKIHNHVQELVFDTARSVGLSPHCYYGAGHIHIDARTGFNGDPVKLLNFMTDINNIGIWPFQNSRMMRTHSNPMAALPDSKRRLKRGKGKNQNSKIRKRYKKLISQEWNNFECRKRDPLVKAESERDDSGRAIKELLERINNNVYLERKKYQMLNACHAEGRTYEETTLEIRAFDAQKSAGDLLLQLQLLERALQSTRTDEVFAYKRPRNLKFENDKKRKEWVICNDAIDELVPRIVDYFQRLEIDLSKYVDMMPMELQELVMKYYNDPHRRVGRSPSDGDGASQEKEEEEEEEGG